MKKERKQVEKLLLVWWQLLFDSMQTFTLYQSETSAYLLKILSSDSVAVVDLTDHTSDGGSLELLFP